MSSNTTTPNLSVTLSGIGPQGPAGSGTVGMGPAGGDLSGNYPNPVVSQIGGQTIPNFIASLPGITNTSVSNLPASTALSGAELIPVVQTGTLRNTTAAMIAALAGTSSLNGADASRALVTATATTTAVALADRFRNYVYASDFGAKMDVHVLVDCNVTSGSNTILSPSITAADNNKTVVIKSVGTNSNRAIPNNGTISRNITSVNPGVSFVIDGVAPTSTVAATTAYIGGTDDTAAINAAILAAYKMGGGKVMLTGATLASQIVLYRNVCLSGSYQGGTELLQKAGTNANFITTENFAALVGSGLRYGNDPRVPSWCGLTDLFIDCQSTQDGRTVGNTSGNGVCFYGNAMYMRNVLVVNAAVDNIFSEGAASNVFTLYDYRAIEEGYWDNVTARGAGNNNITWHGQNDTRMGKIVCSNAGNYNFYSDVSGTLYSGSLSVDELHSYFSVNGTGVRIGAPADITQLYIDTDNVTFDSGAYSSKIGGINFLNAGYKNLSAMIVNTDYLVIGNITCQAFSGATAGTILINLGTHQTISLGNVTIDLTANPNAITGVYSHGGFCQGNITTFAAQVTGQIGLDVSGTNCNYTHIGVLVATGMKYTQGGNNILRAGGYFLGSQVAFSGSISSTDQLTRFGSDAVSFNAGYALQVNQFAGSEKVNIGASTRFASRTVTAAGTITIAPNTDNIIVVNKTTGAATTVNLPVYPVGGDVYRVIDGKGDAGTNNITLSSAGGQTINGSGTTKVMNVNNSWAFITFDGTGWQIKVV